MEPKTLEVSQVLSLLKEYSESLPQKINPPEEEKLLLLVEPVNFKELILQSPGVSIFKALFGRGKTYGIGYYTVHYCESTEEKECSAIYINLRHAHKIVQDRIKSAQKPADPHGDLLQMISNTRDVPDQMPLELAYIILSILDPRTRDSFETNVKGNFLVTTKISKLDPTIIDNIKAEILKSPTSSEKLSRLFEILVEKLIIQRGSSPKLILILDEFEQLVGANIEYKQIIGQLLQILLESLRSERGGVLERYPYRFVLVLTVQQVVYPSELMRSYKATGKPVIGKISAISDDLSIPIRFSPCAEECIKEYYEKALNLLARKGLISETERKGLERVSNCLSYYLGELVKMPARLFFDRIRDVIARLVTEYKSEILRTVEKSNGSNICNDLEGIFNSLRESVSTGLYSIYMEREVTGLGKDKILSMLKELADSLEADKAGEKRIVEVRANGYEGVVVLHPDERYLNIFIYKGRSTKVRESSRQSVNSFRQGFIKHYGDKLVEYCSPPTRSKKEDCKVFIVHPEEADVTAFFDAIYSISQIHNTSISKRVFDVPLDRDELAALYVKSPTLDATTAIGGVIGGDITYYEQRFKELINEIKSKISVQGIPQGGKK